MTTEGCSRRRPPSDGDVLKERKMSSSRHQEKNTTKKKDNAKQETTRRLGSKMKSETHSLSEALLCRGTIDSGSRENLENSSRAHDTAGHETTVELSWVICSCSLVGQVQNFSSSSLRPFLDDVDLSKADSQPICRKAVC